jgi:RND family efflux transporter MFP subunit
MTIDCPPRNILGFLLLTIAAISVGCGKSEPQAAPRDGRGTSLPTKTVQLAAAEERSLARNVEAPGTLAADEQATLSFKVAGRLNQLRVDLGSHVRKGQPIAQLETTEFRVRVEQSEAALQQARARLGLPPQGADDRINIENTALVREARAVLEEARNNRARTVQLVDQGVQPKAELDRVESTFKVADSRYQDAIEEVRNRQAVVLQRRSEVAIARQQLAETTLYVPFEGAINERRATIGEYLAAGAPVVTIVRMHPLRLRIEVPERESIGVRAGLPVRVLVEGDPTVYTGRVARLSPAFLEQSRTLVIEAEVDNQHGRLRPGSFAKAQIQLSTTSGVVMVPESSIVTFAGIQKVFLVKDGKAVEKNIIVGRREEGWVEITEGVSAGDQVVVKPGNLVGGQPVAVGAAPGE